MQQQQQMMKAATPRPSRRSEPVLGERNVELNPRQLQSLITTKPRAVVPQPRVVPITHQQPQQGRQTPVPVPAVRTVPVTIQQPSSDDNISVRSGQSGSRMRAVSIENLHKSPGRVKLSREESIKSQQSVGPRKSRLQEHSDQDSLRARLVQLEKERDDLELQTSKAHDALEEVENKRDKLERVVKEERENSKNRLLQVEAKKEELTTTNYQMQQLIKTMREKMETLEAANEDLKVNVAVMKAEKHNAISALENYQKKQQNVTEEMAHLYKLNSEQAVKITEFEKEKKLNTEEFAYLYKTKNDQADRLAKLEQQEKDLSQFHKTISDQAIKISDLEKINTTNQERLASATENERKIKDLENGKIEKNKELKSLDNTILEQATNVSNLEREIKSAEEEISRLNQQKTDQNVKINELQREIEKLRKIVSDQSNKLNEAESLKKDNLSSTHPKKDIFQDLSRLKDHYQETINSLKTKYEETKILLSLRDQELAVLRRRNHKQDIMEIDSEARKDSVESIDTVDENDVE